MSKKQYTLQKSTIELVSMLLASLVGYYIVLKPLYSLNIIMVGYVMKLILITYKVEPRTNLDHQYGHYGGIRFFGKNNDVLKKRMELFHYEYQSEQQEYAMRKEQEDDANLTAILKYTQDTFFHMEFDEAEVFKSVNVLDVS